MILLIGGFINCTSDIGNNWGVGVIVYIVDIIRVNNKLEVTMCVCINIHNQISSCSLFKVSLYISRLQHFMYFQVNIFVDICSIILQALVMHKESRNCLEYT